MNLDRLYARLEAKEGSRSQVYDDATGKPIGPGSVVVGHPTIGVGHACDVNHISPGVIRQMLHEDTAAKIADLRGRVDFFDSLDDVRQEILVEMAFNLGSYGLVNGFLRMMAAIRRRDYVGAAVEMESSLWAGQVGSRATELVSAMKSGKWTA